MSILDEAREHLGKIVAIPEEVKQVAPNLFQWETEKSVFYLFSDDDPISFDSMYRNEYAYVEHAEPRFWIVAENK